VEFTYRLIWKCNFNQINLLRPHYYQPVSLCGLGLMQVVRKPDVFIVSRRGAKGRYFMPFRV
ncbi:MAG: hypothetical protein KDC45_15415, partial [Bacteroidetes bacterium]|nr:hypothetical protein [Bacteroidota bacterium]